MDCDSVVEGRTDMCLRKELDSDPLQQWALSLHGSINKQLVSLTKL